MTNLQEDRLIQSCKLLVKKLEKQKYWRMNGELPPVIRKQLASIIKQARGLQDGKIQGKTEGNKLD